MVLKKLKFSISIIFIYCFVFNIANLVAEIKIPNSQRSLKAIKKVETSLKQQLKIKGLSYGSAIFIRIFKESSQLEVWVKNANQKFTLFKNYDICTFSGDLGPKLKEGDWQSPEGFYFVKPIQLNPWSRFHLSFNLGYPNRYDRSYGRTGDALMVHGNCVSVGCYAMTDQYIEEIYALANAAFQNGQPFFRVHAFPFKLNAARLAKEKNHQWHSFWVNLKEGYDYFENKRIPPNVEVENRKYVFD